ncbi:GFA family protein [Trinickia caryophylli]|uniref:Uncharacterized conserved protein n=2 Tax=Trinickia caryophylli TaxID=28094 RepID=A0A1X7FRQ0_TRICW|nr:GFA family protein [Trinickia caryophylli]WQE15532.1 GFA family protein [Trinickia caryophylli]GLU33718.1 aldehyde-activating protein [Trinickia caryophylli]SMF57450.1 Uncharacterized conserved protein [Trinickia caryophylli]
MLEGGCFCGRIRYELLAAPFSSLICHCMDCRRIAGAPFVAWLTVKASELRVVRGEPKAITSSAEVMRTFCGHCGSQLTYRHAKHAGEIDVATGTLDEPAAVPPTLHTWVSQKLPWIVLSDGLPQYARDGQSASGV